ncbi:MAG: amidohydrolase family protein [Pseudomonadota bacterium]|nr:amidohydrolase family protein [Pseudomonadota bacterium]
MPRPAAIVDTHHHLWVLAGRRYPWLQEAYDPRAFILGEYRALCQDFDAPAFRRSFGAAPVVASVHVEAECCRTQALAETQWLHQQHASCGLPSAVVAWVDLLAPDAGERLAEQAAWPLLRGVRFKPVTGRAAGEYPTGPGSLRDAHWPRALQRLARHGLRWDLRVPFWHLQEAAAMLADAPAVTVVLEHTGLPWDRGDAGLAVWRKGMQALADNPHVYVKLSELGLRGAPWHGPDNARIVAEAIAIFGWQRCMFGSNFPVASLRASYAQLIDMTQQALTLAGLSEAQQHAVWCGNALACYAIEGVRP